MSYQVTTWVLREGKPDQYEVKQLRLGSVDVCVICLGMMQPNRLGYTCEACNYRCHAFCSYLPRDRARDLSQQAAPVGFKPIMKTVCRECRWEWEL